MDFEWDDFRFDVDGHRLSGPDGDIHLEPQAFDVLTFLIHERDRVVPKLDIIESVWGDTFVSESALTTRIKQIRQALGDDGRTQKYIRNVHGKGYQFVGQLISDQAGDQRGAARTAAGLQPHVLMVPTTEGAESLALDIAVDTEFAFVGRDDERAAAHAALADGRTSTAQVLIGGAPGVGKSRLAVELLTDAAASGHLVCAGRCEASVTSGLQAVRDALAQLALAYPESVAHWASGIEGPLLSLIPSFAQHLDHEAQPVDAYGGIDVFVTAFERISSEAPIVLLIDDLQWADEPTRTFLARVHRRLRGQPITTVATYRSARSDLPDEVRRWIDAQCRGEQTTDIQIGELTTGEAHALISSVAGEDVPAGDVLALAAGHCLFLTESLRGMQQGQSPASSVSEMIGIRLERQPADVQSVVRAGAMFGPEFSFSLATAVADLAPETALDAIGLAIEAELLHETSSLSRFRFSHQLVPEAIIAALPHAKRASLHLACADALVAEDADEVQVAFHRLGAIPLVSIESATSEARAAAARARHTNQFDRALRLLERVLSTDPQARVRAEVLLEIGQIINEQGMPADALESLEQVASMARTNGWTDLFVDAAMAHWSQSPFRKPHDRATHALLVEADQMLGPAPSVAKAKVMAKTATCNVFREPLSARDAATAAALEMATTGDATPAERLEILDARHITFSCPAGVDELERLDPEIESIRIAENSYFIDASAPETAQLMRGNGDGLRRVTRADADRLAAQPIAEWRDLVVGSSLAAFVGEFDEARLLCDRGAEIGEPFWGDSSFALHTFGHFFFDLVSDEWGRSVELLDLMMAVDATPIFAPPHALAHAAIGDLDGALAAAQNLKPAQWPRFGEHILGGTALVAAGELALLLDDDELAQAAEAALLPYQELVLGVPWGATSLAAADPLARLAERRGDVETGVHFRAQANRLYESLGAPSLAKRLEGGS